MDDTSAQTYVAVVDGDADIAMTMDGDQMKVQAPGRRPMQKVYLWEGNKDGASKKKDRGSGYSNKAYKPEEDGPSKAAAGGRLPTDEELQPGQSAVQYLEVGLVIGDNPGLYKAKASDKKKDIKAERQRRGEMQRAPSAIRAFIPVTENIPTQSKYYVGTKFTAGRLNPRSIDGEFIFFYPEFWQGVEPHLSKTERRTFINNQTKQLAAAHKTQAERATASITVDHVEKWATSNPLAVTPAENLANTLVLQYTLWQETGDRSNLRNMLSLMTNAASDLRYGPHTAAEGVTSFFEFGEDLSVESAQLLVRELKVCWKLGSRRSMEIEANYLQIAVPAMPNLAIDVVQAVHSVLKKGDHGKRLPYGELPFFLGICNANIPSVDMAEKVIEQEVERALQTVHLHGVYNTGRTTSNVESTANENHRLVLSCTKDTIDQLTKFMRDSSQQVAEQHGGILRQAGIKELMSKVGGAVDVVHLQSLVEQVAGLHAVQHTAANGQAVEQLSQLSELLGKTLFISQ
jgi:hypothetical protein